MSPPESHHVRVFLFCAAMQSDVWICAGRVLGSGKASLWGSTGSQILSPDLMVNYRSA